MEDKTKQENPWYRSTNSLEGISVPKPSITSKDRNIVSKKPSNPFDDYLIPPLSGKYGKPTSIRGTQRVQLVNMSEESTHPFPFEEDKEKLVICNNGKKYPQKECCYSDGKWFHSSESEYVTIDAYDGKLIAKRRAYPVITKIRVVNGSVGVEQGFVHQNNTPFVIPFYSNKLNMEGVVISESCIEGWKYKEDISCGKLVDFERKIMPVSEIVHYDSFKNPYFKDGIDDKTKLKMGIISPSYQISEGVRYSFGVEIELARGFIPYWKSKQFNISVTRDGSLNNGAGGAEVVTGILKGDTGFYHLQEICNELAPRTSVDRFCGDHFHVGGLDFTDKFIVNMYLLCQILEPEILSIVPASRRDNTYCRNLKKFKLDRAVNSYDLKLKEDYNKLFKWVAFEQVVNPTFKYNKNTQHPLGYKCGYNHSTPRYCWINFVPAMFKTRDKIEYKTIEFRNMEGSTNFEKIKNWALLCLAIVKFADKYSEFIEENTKIEDILLKIYPKKGCKLVEYFNNRKEMFASPSFNEEQYYRDDNKNISQLKTIKELCI